MVDDVFRTNDNEEWEFRGIRRRIMGFDAGTPEYPEEPLKPEDLKKHATDEERKTHAKAMDKWIDEHRVWKKKHARISTAFMDDAYQNARIELKKARRVVVFTGTVSPLAEYNFKQHYNLGDTISLFGDYHQTAELMVSEYIRTEDAEGDRGFPTLIVEENVEEQVGSE